MNQSITLDIESAIAAVADAGLLQSLATIRTLDLTTDAIGGLGPGSPPSYTVHHSDIPCMIGAVSANVRVGLENRTPNLTRVQKYRTVILDSFYEDITPAMQAVVDDEEYNIAAVLHDSQRTFTELLAERITT